MTDLTVVAAATVDLRTWTDVCAVADVTPDRGAAVLVGDHPVAVFRLAAVAGLAEEWYAVDHLDPSTGAPVMARGLIGSSLVDGQNVPTVASPIHKERYDLRTGARIDGGPGALESWQVQVSEGRVSVRRWS